MASEVCPFCGKTYKRLKSHLPHCKAAASSRHEGPAKPTPSPQVAAASLRASSKPPLPSSPPSAHRTTPKVSEQIKASKNQSLTEADKHIKARDAPVENIPRALRTSHDARNNVCAAGEGEAEGLPVNEPRSVQQGSVTLQDVKATLGRTKAGGRSQTHLRGDASPEPTPASSASPRLSGQRSRHAAGTSRDVTGPVSAPTRNPSPRPFQPAPPAGAEAEGAVTTRRLGQVRLRELPDWLACASPRTPRDLVDMVQRGWQWYHRRYIDVKKGGVAGVGLLLAGYCVLSYAWSYPHIKRDRRRKYH